MSVVMRGVFLYYQESADRGVAQDPQPCQGLIVARGAELWHALLQHNEIQQCSSDTSRVCGTYLPSE